MKSIATKSGDHGETGLLYGGRVSKADPRVEAYGRCDEAISLIGLARAHCRDEWFSSRLLTIQETMFTLGAELATAPSDIPTLKRNFKILQSENVEYLDGLVDELEQRVKLAPHFVIPGNSIQSAHMDVARTALRALERAVVALRPANPSIIPYLNRLSDVLFLLGRYQDHDVPQAHFKSGRARIASVKFSVKWYADMTNQVAQSKPLDALEVAKYILWLRRTASTDQLQLVKLVYICHGWMLGLHGQPLFEEKVEAWRYGPVVRVVYDEYKEYKYRPIEDKPLSDNLDDEGQRALIEEVVGKYWDKNGLELLTITHMSGTPWDITFNQRGENNGDGIISNALIQEYYADLAKDE